MSVYASLTRDQNEIRLLDISPRASDDPQEQLKCRLSVHSLDEAPSYTALSYVWGDPKDTRPIVVNDCAAEATVNLVDALLQQRELGTLLIWADALCINQKDNVEKAQQIQLMGTVYGRATNVVAWIGLSDSETERTLENIVVVAQIGRAFDIDIGKILNNSKVTPWLNALISEKMAIALCDSPVFRRGDIGSILTFWQRSYWTRLWTVQELCLARNASIFCGQYSVSWETCELAFVWLSTLNYAGLINIDKSEFHKESFQDLCRPFVVDRELWTGPRAAHISARLRSSRKRSLSMWTLFTLTCNNTNLQATDPKDRVYAIHSLLHEEERNGLSLGPRISCHDLYIQTTLRMLSQYGPRVFASCATVYRSDTSLQLPSWAVDWTCTFIRAEPDHVVATPLAVPYLIRTAQFNKLILKAALVGRIVMLADFSGKLDDMLGIVNDLESTSAQHSVSASLLDCRMQAWRALLSEFSNVDDETLEWLDEFVCRRAHRTPSTNNTVATCGTQSRSGSPTAIQSLEAASEEESQEYRQRFPDVCANTVFVTEGGYIGYARPYHSLKVGDAVYAFPGYSWPFVLRPEGEENGARLWSLVVQVEIGDFMDVEHKEYELVYNFDKFWDLDPNVEEICLI